jgi:hypothetical protein
MDAGEDQARMDETLSFMAERYPDLRRWNCNPRHGLGSAGR